MVDGHSISPGVWGIDFFVYLLYFNAPAAAEPQRTMRMCATRKLFSRRQRTPLLKILPGLHTWLRTSIGIKKRNRAQSTNAKNI